MAVSGTGSSDNRNTNTNNSNSNSNSGNPYVCLSAHCDLLHFVGSVPHPYGGPTPQTIADRTSRYVRFSCESLEKTPTVVVKCEHPLFSSVPIEKNSNGVPFFPFSGVGLAQWGFRHNFDVSSSDSKSEFKLQQQQQQQQRQSEVNDSFSHSQEPHHVSEKIPNNNLNEATSSLPVSSEVETTTVESGIYGVINPFALRRVILQALCVLNLPKRSPAVAFTFCAHDTTPFGATNFLILPRCAEQIPALANPVKVNLVVTRVNNVDVLGCNFPSSDLQKMNEIKNDGNMCSLPSISSPLFLQWELKEDTAEKSQIDVETVNLGLFLSKIMIFKLFYTSAVKFSEGTENKDDRVRRVVSWTQRRSFHLLALIAHCIWCEKVGWYVMNSMNSSAGAKTTSSRFNHCRAHLKWRNDASFSNPNEKWETTLIFYSDASSGNDNCCKSEMQSNLITPSSSVVLHLTVRGCDEEMCWDWSGPVPRVVRGGLCILHK